MAGVCLMYMTHESRNAGIGIAVLILIAGAFGFHYWYSNRQTSEAPQLGQVAGEADDSESIPDGTPTTQAIKLGETARIAGVKINPSEIIEDSRCPKDVQCIQAGTVRVGTVVTPRQGADTDSTPVTFQLGVPMTVGLDQVTLIEVLPAPAAGTTINPNDYVFTFTVVKGAGTEFFKG
jgi:hypothetical protein